MDKTGQKIFPPLRIWIFLLITSLLIVGLLFYLDHLKTQNDFDSRSRYVSQVFATAKGKPVVLVIGTSLLEFGLDSSRKIESCVEELSGKPFVLLKLYLPGATLSDFTDNMKVLRQVKPDIVVVEANMLFYRALSVPVQVRYLYIFHFLFLEGKSVLYQPYVADLKPVGGSDGRTVDQDRNGLTDTSDISSFRDLAVSWQAKGTRFLFINFPIEKSEEFKKWNRPDTSAFNLNMRYLKEKLKIDYFNERMELDSSFFYYYTHLKPNGLRIFSNSFCNALAREMK